MVVVLTSRSFIFDPSLCVGARRISNYFKVSVQFIFCAFSLYCLVKNVGLIIFTDSCYHHHHLFTVVLPLCIPVSMYYMASISSHLLSQLQSVMNGAARLIFSSSKFQHITSLLRQLHCLKAPERIAFKYAVLVYKYLHGSAPVSTSFVRWQMSRLISDSVPVHPHH